MRTIATNGWRHPSPDEALGAGPTLPRTGNDDQARISAALAQVGQELMRSLAKPVFFERLCQIAAEVLHGDASSTLLRDGKSRGYLPVARHGESRRFAYLANPSHPIALEVSARLKHENVVEIAIRCDDEPDGRVPSLWLCIALRRCHRLAGIVVVGRLDDAQAFSHEDRAIAEGIGRLASLGLENVRLLSEIERANHIKSDFVATMSHELRTPLHIILGYLNLVLDGDFGALTEEQSEALQNVDRSARALLELVQDTLDLSRLEREGVPVVRKELTVAELFAALERETQKMPRTAGVELDWQAPDDVPIMQTDPGKLKIALRSLISNALKFTVQGSVKVSARACAGGVEFTVADTGMGVPRSSFARIFEPFTQLGQTSTRTHGGVGMGLYIARRMTELLGGTIAVSSRLGAGSSFQVWVPADGSGAHRDSFQPASAQG